MLDSDRLSQTLFLCFIGILKTKHHFVTAPDSHSCDTQRIAAPEQSVCPHHLLPAVQLYSRAKTGRAESKWRSLALSLMTPHSFPLSSLATALVCSPLVQSSGHHK